jgi:hypothetical protein
MTLTELKSNLHNLIDQVESKNLLEEYYAELKRIVSSSKHKIWDTLSEEEKKEILMSYEESEDAKNLVDSDMVMEKYKKWL